MPLTRHWCQYTRGILWEAESHRAKAEVNQTSDENQLTVLGRNTNHMEMDRVLQLRGDKVVTRSNAKPEGAELGPWHLSPALHHTQGPEQDYFPVWGKMSLSLFRPAPLDVVQKAILWSYATKLRHSCAQAIHGNARV